MSLLKPVSEGIYVLFCMVWCLNTVMRASNRFLVDGVLLTKPLPVWVLHMWLSASASSCLEAPLFFGGTNDDIFQTLMLCIEWVASWSLLGLAWPFVIEMDWCKATLAPQLSPKLSFGTSRMFGCDRPRFCPGMVCEISRDDLMTLLKEHPADKELLNPQLRPHLPSGNLT